MAKAIHANILWKEKIKITKPIPATILGKGTINRLKEIINKKKVELVIFNSKVTPSQQRNLEKIWQCKVLDRTGLILAIFASRARTKEGILQVELASLSYQKSRLVKSWTHLERQRGGLSFIGGPGEAQLEIDRRLLDTRIKKLKKQLEKVDKTRKLQRVSRQKVPYPIISLIGYTNAGKSTLFNQLTKSNVYVQDQVFATLDPTMRLLKLPSGKKVILSDTVGFISNIPTQLIAAFKSTLQEIIESSLLLHIIDCSTTSYHQQYKAVKETLKEIGLKEKAETIIDIYNKIDQVEESPLYLGKRKNSLFVSAKKREGCQDLLKLIDKKLKEKDRKFSFKIISKDSKAIAWLHENANILSLSYHKDITLIAGFISEKNYGFFDKNFLQNPKL